MVVVVMPTKNTPSNLVSADSTARLQLSRSSNMEQAYCRRAALSRRFRTSNMRWWRVVEGGEGGEGALHSPSTTLPTLYFPSCRMNVTFISTRYSVTFPFSMTTC